MFRSKKPKWSKNATTLPISESANKNRQQNVFPLSRQLHVGSGENCVKIGDDFGAVIKGLNVFVFRILNLYL
jgi:hypothetical protein